MGGVPAVPKVIKKPFQKAAEIPKEAAKVVSKGASAVAEIPQAVVKAPEAAAKEVAKIMAPPKKPASAVAALPTPEKEVITPPAREVTRSTEEQRRAAAVKRARRIGARGLLSRGRGSTLGYRGDDNVTLGSV